MQKSYYNQQEQWLQQQVSIIIQALKIQRTICQPPAELTCQQLFDQFIILSNWLGYYSADNNTEACYQQRLKDFEETLHEIDQPDILQQLGQIFDYNAEISESDRQVIDERRDQIFKSYFGIKLKF